MKPWLSRALVAAGMLAALAGSVVIAGDELADIKMNRVVELAPYPLVIEDDAGSLARGEWLYRSRGCADCHGTDGSGTRFLNDGRGFVLAGPAIGPGPGSATARYAPADWERTIRHGVKPDGRPVLMMPSERYNRLGDEDLSSLVAYVRALPARRGRPAVLDLPLKVRVLYGFGALQDAAAKIDHRLLPGEDRPVARSAGSDGG
jgi:mono/diheme cytochrome c family protein